MLASNDNQIVEILKRLERIENIVFSGDNTAYHEDGFSGPTGGVRFLISKNYFKRKRELSSIKKTMAENDYHYNRQAIQEALQILSKNEGPLVSLIEGHKKVYVQRK